MQPMKRKQRGVILLIALVFLLLTTIIATTVMSTSIQEVKMSANDQFKEEAYQQTYAVINAIAANEGNFSGDETIGYRLCPAEVSGTTDAGGTANETCDDTTTMSITSGVIDVPAGVTMNYQVERLAPLVSSLPFRLDESDSSSSSKYGVRFFESTARYDGSDGGLGWTEMSQGIGQRIGTGGSAYY